MAKSGGKGIEGEANAKAKQSFRTRMIKNWLKDMKKMGVVDNANRILDKEKYAEEFAKYKPEIEKAVKDQFSALKENEDKKYYLVSLKGGKTLVKSAPKSKPNHLLGGTVFKTREEAEKAANASGNDYAGGIIKYRKRCGGL